jgi:hypothetical protein
MRHVGGEPVQGRGPETDIQKIKHGIVVIFLAWDQSYFLGNEIPLQNVSLKETSVNWNNSAFSP